MKFKDNLLKNMMAMYVDALIPQYGLEESVQLVHWLVEDFFGATRTQLTLNPGWRLTESEMLKLHWAVKDLLNNRPVQYILGKVSFFDLVLKVTPEVLIPRPETEELVDWILVSETEVDLSFLDAGTGSGCIALALKKQRPHARVLAYDKSLSALKVATENAGSHGLEVVFFEADMCEESLPFENQMDVIISNPPYVLNSEQALMQANVLENEPHVALFVEDETPLFFYEGILKQAARHLKTGGRIYFEINEKMGEKMLNLLGQHGYVNTELKSDLRGKPRFVRGMKG